MQLDRTHVAIRLRTLSEIGDLAMIMIRRYPTALLIGFAVGALPWAMANAALLSWIPLQEAAYGLEDEEAVSEITRYIIWMGVLILLQTPAAGVMTTIYLGQAVFEKRPTWKSVFRETRRQFKRWFYVLGIRRLAVPAMILTLLLYDQPLSGFFDGFIPLALLLFVAVVRSSRPFLPEILLLEQCPLRSKLPDAITVKRRSKSLHGPVGSELGGRFLAVACILLVLTLCIFNTLFCIRGISTGQWGFMDFFVLLVLVPVSMWIVAGISVLIRLLNYLDTRIRLEGWEVELAIRAEALRQFGQEANALSVAPAKRPSAGDSAADRQSNEDQAAERRETTLSEPAGVTR